MTTDFGNAAALTPRQVEKRRKALHTVIRIVGESGVSGVNMKAVSLGSGVALATLYRLFNSRDHMLAAAFLEWQSVYYRRQRDMLHQSGPLADRLFEHLRVGMVAFEQNPNYLSLALTPALSSDPHASREIHSARMDGVRFLSEMLAELGPDEATIVAHTIEACIIDHYIQWMTGRLTFIGVIELLRRQVDMLLG